MHRESFTKHWSSFSLSHTNSHTQAFLRKTRRRFWGGVYLTYCRKCVYSVLKKRPQLLLCALAMSVCVDGVVKKKKRRMMRSGYSITFRIGYPTHPIPSTHKPHSSLPQQVIRVSLWSNKASSEKMLYQLTHPKKKQKSQIEQIFHSLCINRSLLFKNSFSLWMEKNWIDWIDVDFFFFFCPKTHRPPCR